MRKLGQLRASTRPEIRSRSHSCKAKLEDIDIVKEKGITIREIKIQVKDSNKVHRCILRFFGKISTNTAVWVSCDCENFRYVWETSLTATGNSSIIHSTGERPRKRNPRLRSGLCKHLYKASELAVKLKAGGL